MKPRIALQSLAIIALLFFALPSAFIALNEWLEWPRWRSELGDVLGTLVIGSAIAVFFYCSELFRRIGRGTPAPNIVPPTHLVDSGLYGFSRNPMYVSYLGIAVGIVLVEGHLALLLYIGAMLVLAELYVTRWEEPGLAERFGAEWDAYRARVPRWLLGTRSDL